MDQERTTRSLRAVAVAVTVGVVTYFLMRNSNWAPDDPTAESGGQGTAVAIFVAVAIAVPWLYRIWSDRYATRKSAELMRIFNDDDQLGDDPYR